MRIVGLNCQRPFQMSLRAGFVIVLKNIDNSQHEFGFVILVIQLYGVCEMFAGALILMQQKEAQAKLVEDGGGLV